MAHDEEFEPRLGKPRTTKTGRSRRYLHQVLAAVSLAGGARGKSKARFQGNRIGRGAGVGRVLAARDRYAAYRQRRVVIKSRIVKLAGKGLAGAGRHLRYLQRDGVTREGQPGQLYDAAGDRVDGDTFLGRGAEDRHQFRIIVSAEDGEEYDDLKGVTRRLMAQMEADLGTKLDWVAVDHFNTGHPHTHIVIRGKDETDKDLIIAREYLSQGMRERAAEIVSFDLGPKSDFAIESQLKREVEQERLTSLDRALLRSINADGLVMAVADAGEAVTQTLRAGRLQKLKRLDLAEEARPGIWRLNDDLEPTLRRMGERGDIIKTLHRAMAEKDRAVRDYAIFDPREPNTGPLVGRIATQGLSDELNDRHYLVIEGLDGRSHYADIGAVNPDDVLPGGTIVQLAARPTAARAVDETVAAVAAAQGGRYSLDLHLQYDPRASVAFAETHVRRLEALRRGKAGVTRELDGTWTIAPDHVARAAAFERRRASLSPVRVEVLSTRPVQEQAVADGPTWLDRQLMQGAMPRDAGFGHEVQEALARRQQWLLAQDLAAQEGDTVRRKPNALADLQRRELRRAGAVLSKDLGLDYAEAPARGNVSGVYRQFVSLGGGRFAVIAKAREFTLVPWRPALENQLGKQVSGVVRASGISWSIGRQRSGPTVS